MLGMGHEVTGLASPAYSVEDEWKPHPNVIQGAPASSQCKDGSATPLGKDEYFREYYIKRAG